MQTGNNSSLETRVVLVASSPAAAARELAGAVCAIERGGFHVDVSRKNFPVDDLHEFICGAPMDLRAGTDAEALARTGAPPAGQTFVKDFSVDLKIEAVGAEPENTKVRLRIVAPGTFRGLDALVSEADAFLRERSSRHVNAGLWILTDSGEKPGFAPFVDVAVKAFAEAMIARSEDALHRIAVAWTGFDTHLLPRDRDDPSALDAAFDRAVLETRLIGGLRRGKGMSDFLRGLASSRRATLIPTSANGVFTRCGSANVDVDGVTRVTPDGLRERRAPGSRAGFPIYRGARLLEHWTSLFCADALLSIVLARVTGVEIRSAFDVRQVVSALDRPASA